VDSFTYITNKEKALLCGNIPSSPSAVGAEDAGDAIASPSKTTAITIPVRLYKKVVLKLA